MYGLYWGENEILDTYKNSLSKDSIIENIMIENSEDFKDISTGGRFSGFHNIMIFKEGSKEILNQLTKNEVIESGDYNVVSLMSYFTKKRDEYTNLLFISLDFMNSEEKARVSCRLNIELVNALKKLPKKKVVKFIEEKLIDYLLSKIESGNLIKYFKNKNVTFFAGDRLIILKRDGKFENISADKLNFEEINNELPKHIVDYKLDKVLVKQVKKFAELNNMSITDVIIEALTK